MENLILFIVINHNFPKKYIFKPQCNLNNGNFPETFSEAVTLFGLDE